MPDEVVLLCGVCLFDPLQDRVQPAITVINGYAVCDDHTSYVAKGERFGAIRRILENEARLHDEQVAGRIAGRTAR